LKAQIYKKIQTIISLSEINRKSLSFIYSDPEISDFLESVKLIFFSILSKIRTGYVARFSPE